MSTYARAPKSRKGRRVRTIAAATSPTHGLNHAAPSWKTTQPSSARARNAPASVIAIAASPWTPSCVAELNGPRTTPPSVASGWGVGASGTS